MKKNVLILVGLLLFSTGLAAEPVYRWVDAEGRVGYSSQPPPDAQQVEQIGIAPAPDEAQVDAARKRMEKEEQTASALARERRQRDEERAEQRERRRQQQPSVTVNPREEGDSYYFGYPYRPLYRPGRPGYRPGRPQRPGQGIKPRPRPPVTGRPLR